MNKSNLKNLIIGIIVGSIVYYVCNIKSCDTGSDKLKVITKLIQKDTVVIPPQLYKDIKNFRPFVQNIILSYYKYSDEVKVGVVLFSVRGFDLWIGNDYDYFELYKPQKVAFNPEEKEYLWRLYKSWYPTIEIPK